MLSQKGITNMQETRLYLILLKKNSHCEVTISTLTKYMTGVLEERTEQYSAQLLTVSLR